MPVVSPTGTLRLLSVPARHPYVDAVRPARAHRVHEHRVSGWQPDPIFDSATARAWALDVDVVHLHFGFDALSPAGARAWLEALRHSRTPLVLTVHDLRNPHHHHRDHHDAVLAELVPAAAAVLTLTHGAAREIARRFGRLALVVPHPTLVDPSPTVRVRTEPGMVTLHLKSLRRNLVDPLALVAACAQGATDTGGWLRVDVHLEVVDDPRLVGLRALLTSHGGDLVVHERFDDLALQRYLRASHVTVLPHRWGTHSGWLELARDLGTRVVAPSCGYYREQWQEVVLYPSDELRGLDADGLRNAVAGALRRPAPAPADRSLRLRELDAVRRTHAEVYARVLAAPVSGWLAT